VQTELKVTYQNKYKIAELWVGGQKNGKGKRKKIFVSYFLKL